MQDVSSLGRAQPRAKSINVEANVLQEWLEASSHLERQIRVRLTMLLAATLAGVAIIPALQSLASFAWQRAQDAREESMALASREANVGAEGKEAAPRLEDAQMLDDSRAKIDLFLGNVIAVVNAAPTKVAFNSLHGEALGGELTLICKSEAEDYESGRLFVTAASLGPSVIYAVQASTKKSTTLGKDGVAFDFIKRIGVAR